MPTTVTTAKHLPVSMPNMQALVAGLGRVCRVDKNHRNSSNGSLVVGEHPQLIERPTMVLSSLRFPNLCPLSDTRKVFKGDSGIQLFGLCYQRLADIVVDPILKSCLSPRKPSQQSSRTASAFGLDKTSDACVFSSDGLKLATIPVSTCRSAGYCTSAKVNPKYFGSFPSWLSRNVYPYVYVVRTLARLLQGCTGRVLPFKQGNLIPTNRQTEVLSTRLQSNPDHLSVFKILKGTNVQTDRSRSKLVDLFNCFSVTNYSPYCLADMVCLQTSSLANRFVNLMVQLNSVPTVISFSHFQYLIASISKTLKCVINVLMRLCRDYKLTLYIQGLTHAPTLTHPEGSGTFCPAFLCQVNKAVSIGVTL